MSAWVRDRVPLLLGLGLLGCAVVWAWWAYRQSGDALAWPGFVVALAAVVVGVIPLLELLGRRQPARKVDVLAAQLAEAVDGQWRQAAIERRLTTPEPIPLHWSLSDLAVTGPLSGALGTPDEPPAFPPLPGTARITEADLQAGGGRVELHRVYAGLTSGRIIVVGAPGAGKSATAILLLLDALRHYSSVEDTQRARVPVPVLLTAHGWDPTTRSIRDWLCDRLTAIYPMFAHRTGRAEATDLVTARDKIALILDGFDEMDPALRPAALGALSDAPFRVVVLTRSQELLEATSHTWLTGALAVRLHTVSVPQATDYLQRARTGPAPQGWAELLTHLNEHPESVLARALSTPLALTLLRDTYQAGDDVQELLDPTRYGTVDALEHHLIARVLPTAYTPVPGRPPPRYPEQQAHQTLSLIAHQMGPQRDLTWWHIPRWTPAAPRILITWLLVGLVPGIGLASIVRGWFPAGIMFVLWCALMAGYARGKAGNSEPRRFRIENWRATISRMSRKARRRTLLTGLVFGFSIVSSLVGGSTTNAGVNLAYGLLATFTSLFIGRGTGPGLPMGPCQVWRNDWLTGLVVGLVGGPVFGFSFALINLKSGLVIGLVVGLTFVLLGLTDSQIWPTTLAWLQLQRSHRVPAVRLIPFLEDARERGILRTAGATYQFRHAKLQDHLATATTTVSRSS